MKNKISLVVLIFTTFIVKAQNENKTSEFSLESKNYINKGNIFIVIYKGYPQSDEKRPFFHYDINGFMPGITTTRLEKKGIWGGNIEYLISKKSSISFEASYSKKLFYLNYNDFIDPYSSRTSLTKLRLYPRYNYYINLKKLSLYCHVGIGVSLIDVKIDILDNAINYNGDISELKEGTYNNLLFRTGFGLKYKICEWAGFHGEIGIGGPLFTLGGYIRLKK